MNELKRAIERVLEKSEGRDLTNLAVKDALDHLREVYLTVKERL